MRDLAGFRDAVEQYCKRVGRTQKDLAAALYLTEGDLNKRLHDYSHQPSKRTWRLKPEHILKIVEVLARWGAITARKQAFTLFTLIDFPVLAEEIDWKASPWDKLHVDAPPTKLSPPLSVPVRHRLFQARDLPKEYVPRPNAFNEIKRLLLAQEVNQKTAAITTALRGAGGFGKTTLALALCHDSEIQEAFPDGILWVELGEKPPPSLAVLNELLHVLDPSGREALTLEEARACWRNILEERVSLLVIDDVWQTGVLEELLHGGSRCRRLVTTRNDQLLPDDAKRVWVDAMEPGEAMALLCEGVIDDWQHTLDSSVQEQVVMQQLGCWPLLVSLARGMLKTQIRLHKTPNQALALLKNAYEERGMATFHLGDRDERQRNVDACLDANLHQLEEWVPARYQTRQRYLELAVFPEDTDIPLSTLQIYWQGTGELHNWEVEELCLHLVDLSLLLPWDGERRTIRLHDVLRSYLIQRAGSQVSALHRRLLDASQHTYGVTRWADLPRSEDYLWHRLVYHLCQADHPEALQAMFTDPWYLIHKVLYLGASALEADLAMAASSPNKDRGHPSPMIASLHRAIRQIHHLLQRVSSEAEIGGLLLSYLPEEERLATQWLALERDLPRPFLTAWHPFPQTSSDSLLRTLQGHTASVTECTFSPDGKWIVSGSTGNPSQDGLKVWEVASGTELRILRGYTDRLTFCAFSPDGKFLVSTPGDHTLKVWEVATGAELRTFSGHTGEVYSWTFSLDGKVLVTASRDKTLKVWDVARGTELRTFSGHTDGVYSCAFSPDGTRIVSASRDKTLKIWDMARGTELRTLSGHNYGVTSCMFSLDGTWIVSGSTGGTLKVWEAATGAERYTFSGYRDEVTSYAFSPDGKILVFASRNKTLKAWDVARGTELRTLSGHADGVTSCAFSPDGTWVVSASEDSTLRVWEIQTGRCVITFPFEGNLRGCRFHSNEKHLVAYGGFGLYFLRLVP